jgi:hypothetical protein
MNKVFLLVSVFCAVGCVGVISGPPAGPGGSRFETPEMPNAGEIDLTDDSLVPDEDRTVAVDTTLLRNAIRGPAWPGEGVGLCPMHLPAECDRCPDSQCRQVRTGADTWVAFCDEGSLFDEAFIACMCNGDSSQCRAYANETVRMVNSINQIFGGTVPPVGTRFNDLNGLRNWVTPEMHYMMSNAWEAPSTIRCETDPVSSEEIYLTNSHLVRTTGSCSLD